MKKLNIGEFCWWLLIGALIVIIGKIVLFDELKYYLHPKMNKFVITALVVLIVLFIYQQSRIFSSSMKPIKIGYFLFLIPMFMLIMAGDAGAVIFENRNFNINGISQVKNSKETAKAVEEEQPEMADTPDRQPEETVYDRLPADEIDNPDPDATDPTDPNAAHIPGEQPPAIAEDPFLTTLFELNEEEEGQEIELTGFVFKNEYFGENEFHVSRMQLNCCVADSFLIGMVVQSPMAKELDNNDWVRVKGVTRKKLFTNAADSSEEKMILMIEPVSIERVEPLETPYVYY